MTSEATRRSRSNTGHFSNRDSLALGCTACPLLSECGGFSAGGVAYDCRSLCCGSPNTCKHAVCPDKKKEFALRLVEVGGIALGRISIPLTQTPVLPAYVPVIDGPASRSQPLQWMAAVVPITAGIRTGRISTRLDLTEHFLIQPDATIILNGVGLDGKIEPLWPWITSDEFEASMDALRPHAIWTPNFSMFADSPRTNDLHSIKRIAICAERIAACGIAPILHLNARTPHDYRRWGKLLSDSSVDLVGFEFRSMTKARREYHCAELCHLAEACDRPLTLLVRAGQTVLSKLVDAFEQVVVVDTEALQLARRRYYVADVGARLDRQQGWSLKGEPVDRFAQRNVIVSAAFYDRQVGHGHSRDARRAEDQLPVIAR